MALITSLIANFFNCFKVCVTAKGYTGRASRYEFWGFMAVSFLLVTLLELTSLANAALIPLLGIYHVLSFIPLIAVAIRRLHDINKSAWQLLLTPLLSLGIAIVVQLLSFLFKLFGVLGIIVMVFIVLSPWIRLIYWLSMRGNPFENNHGPAPEENSRYDRLSTYIGFSFMSGYILFILLGAVSAYFAMSSQG